MIKLKKNQYKKYKKNLSQLGLTWQTLNLED